MSEIMKYEFDKKSFEKAKVKLYWFTNTDSVLLFLKNLTIRNVEMLHLSLLRLVCFSHLSWHCICPRISPRLFQIPSCWWERLRGLDFFNLKEHGPVWVWLMNPIFPKVWFLHPLETSVFSGGMQLIQSNQEWTK